MCLSATRDVNSGNCRGYSNTVISSRARARPGTLSIKKREITIILVWTGCPRHRLRFRYNGCPIANISRNSRDANSRRTPYHYQMKTLLLCLAILQFLPEQIFQAAKCECNARQLHVNVCGLTHYGSALRREFTDKPEQFEFQHYLCRLGERKSSCRGWKLRVTKIRDV